jgi:curved DNA-binding protein CbpA
MTTRKNLYQVLGVRQTASQPAIESAYIELQVKYQSLYDQGDQDASLALFNIKGAYEILSNPKKREAYDEKLAEMMFQPEPKPVMAEKKSEPAKIKIEPAPPAEKHEIKSSNPKLSKCKTCGKEVSITAATCPHCGEKNPVTAKTSGCLTIVLAFFVISIVVGIFSGNKGGSGSSSKYDAFQAQADCEGFVKQNLKAPSSADFASHRELNITGSGVGPWTVIGYVDSQNSFGAKIRSTYICTVHYQGEKVYLDDIKIH